MNSRCTIGPLIGSSISIGGVDVSSSLENRPPAAQCVTGSNDAGDAEPHPVDALVALVTIVNPFGVSTTVGDDQLGISSRSVLQISFPVAKSYVAINDWSWISQSNISRSL